MWVKPILKPFTTSCSRKIRRLARKVKVKHPGVRLAAVFGSAFLCEAIKNAFVESVLPSHPSNLEDDIKDAICGGDCGGADLVTDLKNCGACKNKVRCSVRVQRRDGSILTVSQCPSGAVCENRVCSSTKCDGVRQCNLQGYSKTRCICARSIGSDTHFCPIADTGCADQLTDDCTTNADCQKGEICGFAAGCSIRTCLNVIKCSGPEAEGVPVPSITPMPEPPPKTTSTRTSARTATSTTSIPTPTSSGVVGWVLNVPFAGSNSCCIEYYSNAQCSEGSGSYGYICGDGSAVLKFAVKSWRVYRCSGWWTGPPMK